jgi:hypothetical protein
VVLYLSGEGLGEESELANCIELDGERPRVDFGRAGTSTEVSLVVIDASSIDFLPGCRELDEDEEVDRDEEAAKRRRGDKPDAIDTVC